MSPVGVHANQHQLREDSIWMMIKTEMIMSSSMPIIIIIINSMLITIMIIIMITMLMNRNQTKLVANSLSV